MGSISDYDVGQLVGKGGFASVYRARERITNNEVAIKIIKKSYIREAKSSQRIISEIKIHSRLDHKSIVKLYNYFEDKECIYIVLELCNNGNLYQYLKRFGPLSEYDATNLIHQILIALQYLHERHIIHRDLKLSNILLNDDSEIKICDFGLAIQFEHPDEEHFTLCGTPNYIAPEVITQQSHGYPADLWSVGCLFYYIITGVPPFDEENKSDHLQNQLLSNYIPPSGISENALDFIKCLLHPVSLILPYFILLT